MTQFALVAFDTQEDTPQVLNEVTDCFLVGVAKKLFNNTPLHQIYSLDIDSLMLDAQRSVPDIAFEQTDLYKTIKILANDASEIILWYGSEYSDLDYVYSEFELIKKIKESISNSCCEAYIHFKRDP